MPKLDSKKYKINLERLERMADGISRHGKEPKFPAKLDEAEMRKLKEDLENARTDYESKQRDAYLAYDVYNNLSNQIDEMLTNSDNALRGYYGKANPLLANFGAKVQKERSVSKPSDSSSDKPK